MMSKSDGELVTMEKIRTLLLESLDIKLDVKLQLLHTVKVDVDNLKDAVKELQFQAQDADAYSRRNNIVFHGIPFNSKENPMEVALDIGRALDFNLHPNNIDVVHRLKTRNPAGPPPLIIRLVHRHRIIPMERANRGQQVTASLTASIGHHITLEALSKM